MHEIVAPPGFSYAEAYNTNDTVTDQDKEITSCNKEDENKSDT